MWQPACDEYISERRRVQVAKSVVTSLWEQQSQEGRGRHVGEKVDQSRRLRGGSGAACRDVRSDCYGQLVVCSTCLPGGRHDLLLGKTVEEETLTTYPPSTRWRGKVISGRQFVVFINA